MSGMLTLKAPLSFEMKAKLERLAAKPSSLSGDKPGKSLDRAESGALAMNGDTGVAGISKPGAHSGDGLPGKLPVSHSTCPPSGNKPGQKPQPVTLARRSEPCSEPATADSSANGLPAPTSAIAPTVHFGKSSAKNEPICAVDDGGVPTDPEPAPADRVDTPPAKASSKPPKPQKRPERPPRRNYKEVLAEMPKPDFDPKEATPAMWAEFNKTLTHEQRLAAAQGWFIGICVKFSQLNSERKKQAFAFAFSRRLAIKKAFHRYEKRTAVLARLAAEFEAVDVTLADGDGVAVTSEAPA